MKRLIRLWPAGVFAIGLTVLGLTVAVERRGLANMADAAQRLRVVIENVAPNDIVTSNNDGTTSTRCGVTSRAISEWMYCAST